MRQCECFRVPQPFEYFGSEHLFACIAAAVYVKDIYTFDQMHESSMHCSTCSPAFKGISLYHPVSVRTIFDNSS